MTRYRATCWWSVGCLATLFVWTLAASPPASWPQVAGRAETIRGMIAAGDPTGATAECQAWAEEEPRNPAPHVLLGDIAADQSEPERAEGEYQIALRLDKECVDAYVGLVRLLLRDSPDEARGYLDTASELAPGSCAVMALQGELERQRGRLEEAEMAFTEALAVDPACPDALFGLAASAQVQGREEEAQRRWGEFLAAEKGTDRAWLVENGLVVLSESAVGGVGDISQWPVFSPDGTTLAWCSLMDRDAPRSWEVWTMPADGSARATRVTSGGGAHWPRWALDGQHILFDFLYADGGYNKRVYVVDASGTDEPVGLTDDLRLARSPAGIPGTDRIAFTDAYKVYTMGPDGQDRQLVPLSRPNCPGDIDHLAVSPDAGQLVFGLADWTRDTGPAQYLATAPLAGGEARKLTKDDTNGRLGECHPGWGPDGRRIIYSNDQRRPRQVFDTWVTVLDDPHPAYLLIRPAGRASWSPDGTRIAFDRSAPDAKQIWIATLGGRRLPLVAPPPELMLPLP